MCMLCRQTLRTRSDTRAAPLNRRAAYRYTRAVLRQPSSRRHAPHIQAAALDRQAPKETDISKAFT